MVPLHVRPARIRPEAGALSRSVLRGAALAILVAGLAWAPGPPQSGAAGLKGGLAPSQAGGLSYRLAETWTQRPWTLGPGRYGQVADLSSAPDGRTFVLDGRHQVVHVLDADGRPSHVVAARDDVIWTARRLDAGWDGTYFVLSEGPAAGNRFDFRVDQYSADGKRVGAGGRPLLSRRFYAYNPRAYRDLAVHPDGRLFLSRAGPGNPFIQDPGATPTPPGSAPSAIEILAPDGRLLSQFGTEDLCLPDSLDVDRDGRVYVVNHCPVPAGQPEPEPGPTAPPRPSGVAAAVPPAQDFEAAQEGVLVYDADLVRVAKYPLAHADDLALGPAGAFAARGLELFALGDPEPLYTAPSGEAPGAGDGSPPFRLDVPAGGGLLAGLNHCYFQGLVHLDPGERRPLTPHLAGALDQPELEGPVYPLRLAAGAELAVLQGRYTRVGNRPEARYRALSAGERQVVQRWGGAGDLLDQLGLCGQGHADRTRDLAADGPDIYTLDHALLQRRPDAGFPAWTYWPGLNDSPDVASRLQAVAARDGRVAVLDSGAGRVIVLDRAMRELARWDLAGALAVDLALGPDRVYLAEGGGRRLLVHDLAGRRLAAWPLHEAAQGLDLGPEGDLYVLGQSGWAYRYRPDGHLLAAWPPPEPGARATDLALAADGRVWVSFLVTEGAWLRQAGIWVFEAVSTPPAPPVAPAAACLVEVDKRAAPERLPLGRRVEVALTLEGRCPERARPLQLLLVLDSSRSMGFANALEAAKDGLLALVDGLDPASSEAGLVSFDSEARLAQPLGRDLSALRRQIAAAEAEGDTHLAPGLDLAHAALAAAPPPAGTHRAAVLATDGALKDEAGPAALALRAAGVELWALHYPNAETQPSDAGRLAALTGSAARVLSQPGPEALRGLVAALTSAGPVPDLFASLSVQDSIPANMRYVPGSARPPARELPGELIWNLAAVPAGAVLSLTYTLEPLEVGHWPTNVQATADYRDGLGAGGRRVFPVPWVRVYDPPRQNGLYLPSLDRAHCARRNQDLDLVLVLDSSSSMAAPQPGGGDTLAAAVAAAGAFLDLLRLPADRAALLSFDQEARVHLGLGGSRAALDAALGELRVAPGTRIDRGLALAGEVLAAGGRPAARPVVLLLTDGRQAVGQEGAALVVAAHLGARGVRVFGIGLGADRAPELLRALASRPEYYLESPTAADLATAFRRAAEVLNCE